MSNPENQYDERGLRKSKRQRVPNQYYTVGINQLKKVPISDNRKITPKAQSRKNRTDEEEEYSSEEEKNNISNNFRSVDSHNNHQKTEHSNGMWLPCKLPNNRAIRVQIVIDSSQLSQALKVKEQFPVKPAVDQTLLPAYNNGPPKKAESSPSLNLLSLFQQAIKNVTDELPSPTKNYHNSQALHISAIIQEPALKYQHSSQKPAKTAVLAPPKRVVQQDKDGKIVSLRIDKQNKVMRISHSKIGQCLVPIQVEPPSWKSQMKQQTSEELQQIKQIRKKLTLNPSLLKSIPIFN